jgi:hypothetical protein
VASLAETRLDALANPMRAAILLVSLVHASAACAEPVPPAAKGVIARVHAAASAADYSRLRSLMIEDFLWSFGGDASADQAIAEWRKRPQYIRRLAEITKAKCSYRDGYVECPANARTSLRAGFTRIGDRWKMAYLVEGD